MKLSEIKDIATKIVKEMSGTGGGTTQGSTVTGGPQGEQTFTTVTVKKPKKAKKVKQEVKDVEPKLAAGKVKNNYYVTHFGYTPAPSIPNRKSKAMDYKQLFEQEVTLIDDLTATLASDASKNITIPKGSKVKVLVKRMPNEPKVTQLDYNGEKVNVNAGPFIQQYLSDRLNELETSEYFIQIKNIKDVQNVQNIVADDNLLRGKFKNRGSDVYITGDLEAAREFIDVLNQNGIRNVNNVEDYTDDLDEAAGTDEVVATLNNPNLEPDVKKMLFAAYRNKQITADGLIMIVDLILKKDIVNENYSQFRNKTSKREAPEQLHKAVKEIKKKLQEVDRLVEYTNRLRTEISEGLGEVKYTTHTARAVEQIQEMIKHTYIKAKKLK